jgi:hypothetical protein
MEGMEGWGDGQTHSSDAWKNGTEHSEENEKGERESSRNVGDTGD